MRGECPPLEDICYRMAYFKQLFEPVLKSKSYLYYETDFTKSFANNKTAVLIIFPSLLINFAIFVINN